MSDVAAHLVDEVFPAVPARQWVCSPPWRLRAWIGYDRKLCADVLSAFVSALARSLEHRAKAQLSLRSVDDALVGAVAFVQRCDSSLRLNLHFHSLALDGVYVRGATGTLVFHALAAPTQEEVQQVAAWTHAGIERALRARGRSLDEDAGDAHGLTDEQPVMKVWRLLTLAALALITVGSLCSWSHRSSAPRPRPPRVTRPSTGPGRIRGLRSDALARRLEEAPRRGAAHQEDEADEHGRPDAEVGG